MQPGTLSLRAVHQYRRRDIIPYLGLRLYCESTCARRDRWAQKVCVDHVLRQETRPYYVTYHYKGIGDDSQIDHRVIHLPTPCETLAESALLGACAGHSAFGPPAGVYSYLLPKDPKDSRGIFRPYFEGYRRRHEDIHEACRHEGASTVRYVDIRRYYSSIGHDVAERAWREAAAAASLPGQLADMGVKLLEGYRLAPTPPEGANAGVLTGPMFSHLIGNLILRGIDEDMELELPNGYFRYVDDIVLVGSRERVDRAYDHLRESLESLGLALHPGKRMLVAAAEWREHALLYPDDRQWIEFIGSVKAFLLRKPNFCSELTDRLSGAGMRISLTNYQAAVQERGYALRVKELLDWYRHKLCHVSPSSLATQAVGLRDRYQQELDRWTVEYGSATSDFRRNQVMHMLRCLSWRLVYLAHPDRLSGIADSLPPVPEMRVYTEVFRALHRRDVGDLLPFGTNAAQAVAQPLVAMDMPVACTPTRAADSLLRHPGNGHSEVLEQSQAILALNGVRLADHPLAPTVGSSVGVLVQKVDPAALANCGDAYAREIGCLRAGRTLDEVTQLLRSPFDTQDDMIFDAQDPIAEYASTAG